MTGMTNVNQQLLFRVCTDRMPLVFTQ